MAKNCQILRNGTFINGSDDSLSQQLRSFTPEQKMKLKRSYDFFLVSIASLLRLLLMWMMLIKRNQVGNSRFRLHSQNPDGYKIGSQLATAKYPVCAGGLRKVLKYIKENYKYPEMIVTGNGYRETPGEKDVPHMRQLIALHGAVGGNDYPGDDMSGAQSVTEKLSNVAQNGVPVNNNRCDSGQ